MTTPVQGALVMRSSSTARLIKVRNPRPTDRDLMECATPIEECLPVPGVAA